MSPSLRVALAVSWALGTTAACSSSSPMPADLGDCVKTADAACSKPVSSSGGSGPGDDSGSNEAASGDDGGATCGAAEDVLGTQNTTCIPCIETSCCAADTACSAQTGAGECLAIVSCVAACPSTSTTCAADCQASASSASASAYQDFSACLASSCPGCPTLFVGTASDF